MLLKEELSLLAVARREERVVAGLSLLLAVLLVLADEEPMKILDGSWTRSREMKRGPRLERCCSGATGTVAQRYSSSVA